MNTAYFKDGILYNVSPRNKSKPLYEDRDIAYKADIIVSDGISYTLPNDIDRLPIPNFERLGSQGPTGDLSYVLKMCLSQIKDVSYLPAFIEKVILMMDASRIGWTRVDYLSVIRNYYRHGMFDVGDQYEEEFRRLNPKLFLDTAQNVYEVEHEKTKAYWRAKWNKR